MSRLEDQIRRLAQVMDSMAPPVEDLIPPELADELEVEQRPGIEVRIPLGKPPRRPRFRMPGWAWGLVGAVAAAVVVVPLLLSLQGEQPVASQPTTPTTQTITDGIVVNPVNGHFYEAVAVTGGIEWTEAAAQAEAMSFRGIQGHLVTITSEQENQFVLEVFAEILGRNPDGDLWIGAFQPEGSPEPDGGWQWVTGEAFEYTNWGAGEPNDAGSSEVGNEQCVQYLDPGNPHWNDFPCTGGDAVYIVEYSTSLVADPTLTFDLTELTAHGAGWLPNADISATMPGIAVPTLITTSDDAGAFSIGPFNGCCDSELTVSDGVTTLTVPIPWTVTIWRVDPTKDVIAGTVNDDHEVHVSITGGPDPYEVLIPSSAVVNGSWLLELDGVFDILPGMTVEATVNTGELTFVTHSGTRIDAGSNVELTHLRIEGGGFEPNGLVQIVINGVPLPDEVVVDQGGFFGVNLGPYGVTLEPGTSISISDGTTRHDEVVPSLTFDAFDETLGTASGTSDAPDGAEIEIAIELGPVGADHDESRTIRTQVVGGVWSVEFEPPSSGRRVLSSWVSHFEEGIVFQVHYPFD